MRLNRIQEKWTDCSSGICLVGVTVLLTVIHYLLPAALHEQLVFVYSDPDLMTIWTASLLHESSAHLRSNLEWFLLLSAYTYLLYTTWLQRRTFWIIFGVLFVVTPPLTIAVDYWLVYHRWGLLMESATAQGFSGIVSALGGMLLVAIGAVVSNEYGQKMALATIFAVVLGGAIGVLIIVGIQSPVVVVVLCFGILAITSLVVSITDLRNPVQFWTRISGSWDSILIIGPCCVVMMLLLTALFRIRVGPDGQFVNVVAHGVGLLTGVISSALLNPQKPYGYLLPLTR